MRKRGKRRTLSTCYSPFLFAPDPAIPVVARGAAAESQRARAEATERERTAVARREAVKVRLEKELVTTGGGGSGKGPSETETGKEEAEMPVRSEAQNPMQLAARDCLPARRGVRHSETT